MILFVSWAKLIALLGAGGRGWSHKYLSLYRYGEMSTNVISKSAHLGYGPHLSDYVATKNNFWRFSILCDMDPSFRWAPQLKPFVECHVCKMLSECWENYL